MYKIYFTDPKLDEPFAWYIEDLTAALKACESLRTTGYTFVTMVSDYADMVGNPGAKGAGTEYVPQLLNP